MKIRVSAKLLNFFGLGSMTPLKNRLMGKLDYDNIRKLARRQCPTYTTSTQEEGSFRKQSECVKEFIKS